VPAPKATAREAAYTQLTGHIRRQWQVLGSNQHYSGVRAALALARAVRTVTQRHGGTAARRHGGTASVPISAATPQHGTRSHPVGCQKFACPVSCSDDERQP